MRFAILGGYGIIGKAVVSDLYKFSKGEIIILGRNIKKAQAFASSFKTIRVKAKHIELNRIKSIIEIIKEADVCVNCLQYYFNLEIMKACLTAKVHYVDLGGLFHMTKKQLRLNKYFKKIEKTAILGIGGAPGLSNMLTAYSGQLLNKIKKVEIVFADKDYTNYKQKFILPYSFRTLVEEFTLKPAVFNNGQTIFVKPFSGIKLYRFPDDFGSQQGFLALHSEIATLPKFLKYKGLKNCEFRVTFSKEFANKILQLVDLGFTTRDNIEITSTIMDRLIPKNIKINDKEIIRVILDNKTTVDALTKSSRSFSAGILDTAIPCSIAAIMLANNKIKQSGVYSPERIIPINSFFKELRRRGIKIRKNDEVIN